MNTAHSICFVIPKYVTFSTGGAEVQVYYLVNEFLRRGWQVEVVCAGKGHENEILQSPFLDERIRFHYYSMKRIRSFEFFGVFKALLKTRSSCYYQRTDFVLTGVSALYCRWKKKKMFYALAQDADAMRDKYKHIFARFKYTNILKKWVRYTDISLVDRLVEYGKRSAESIICQNHDQLMQFTSAFKREAVVIPSSYACADEDEREKEPIVLWVGNMRPIKQPELFFELVRKLRNKKGWRFVMIGKESKDINGYRAMVPEVEILGERSYDETNRWFKRAQLYINTSSGEGMPNTFIQSWMNRVAVLSLNVDPEALLKKQKLGSSFNNNLDALCDNVDVMLENKKISDSMLDKAEAFAKASFSVEKNVDKLEVLISK